MRTRPRAEPTRISHQQCQDPDRTGITLAADELSKGYTRHHLDLDTEISYQGIESQDEAEKLQFRGSPTILVSGHDPFADPDASVGLLCRVYRTGQRSSGSPGIAALQRILRNVAS